MEEELTPSSGESSDKLLEVGYIAKSHGIVGEVICVLTSDRVERFAQGSVLRGLTGVGNTAKESEKGIQHWESLEVERATKLPSKGPSWSQSSRWIVKFRGWVTRNSADMLRGTRLYASKIEDSKTLWIDDLIGRQVVDQDEVVRGVVAQVEANPASDLMVLDNGKLVPVSFIVGELDGDAMVHVHVPAGLFDDD